LTSNGNPAVHPARAKLITTTESAKTIKMSAIIKTSRFWWGHRICFAQDQPVV